jgi:uncharacterized membrane protein YciS (DUF1049 family)
MIRLTLLLIIVLFLVTLGFTNSKELVHLSYFFGVATRPIPVTWLIAGTFAAGLVLGWLFMLPSWVKLRLELRRQRRAQDRLEEEIGAYRKTTATSDLNIPTRPEPDEF